MSLKQINDCTSTFGSNQVCTAHIWTLDICMEKILRYTTWSEGTNWSDFHLLITLINDIVNAQSNYHTTMQVVK